jgi:hypothetical protein
MMMLVVPEMEFTIKFELPSIVTLDLKLTTPTVEIALENWAFKTEVPDPSIVIVAVLSNSMVSLLAENIIVPDIILTAPST